jgi:hypothetical protein
MWSARISRNHLDLTIERTQNIVEDSSNVGDVKIEQRHHARIGTLDAVKKPGFGVEYGLINLL